MEKRIIGIIGDRESFTAKIKECNIKTRGGKTYVEVLFSQVKFKNSQRKESHFWANLTGQVVQHKGKRVRGFGIISLYGGRGRESGTTLSNIKIVEVF
ncbi:MAG: hypothetical protein ACRCZL_03470 [Cetobacterium sp.]